MPRKKLEKRNEYIQLVISPEDKRAFDAWCSQNGVTMSEVIRSQIAPYIAKGRKILESNDGAKTQYRA
jgi:antitoxin component of RelBE/YafQ-DinJ toxin-antitoxin module